MPRAKRTSVTGVSRSGRPIGRAIIVSESPSASPSPEPPRASASKKSRAKRQQTRTSMNHSRKSDAQAHLAQAPSGYKVHAESASKSKAQKSNGVSPRISDDMQIDSPEDVEEYTFSSEEEYNNDNDDDYMDDIRSHISLSSDDPPAEQHGIDQRPWLSMNVDERREYESMFIMITHPAVGQSWSYTEEYQAQIDNMLLSYMTDFPLPTWVNGPEAAERAFYNYRERARWRQLGIRIYGAERLPDIFQPKASYPTGPPPPPAAQPMPQQPLPNEVPPQLPQHRPSTGASSRPPSRPVPVEPQVPKSSKLTKQPKPSEPPVPTTLQSSPPADQMKPPQTHAHPPRPRGNLNAAKVPAKAAQKKAKDSTRDSPEPRPVTPPYPARPRPVERRPQNKTGKKPARKPAEAELFAWNRDIDFRAALEKSTWRDDIYNPDTLKIMAEVRKHNEPIIERLDQEVTDKQRVSRNAKKKQPAQEGTPDVPRPGRKRKNPGDKGDNNDPYHAGYFAFASAEIEAKAKAMGYLIPDQVIKAGEKDEISLEELETFKICWNPGRKGLAYELVQAPFSARDAVLTRKQLESTLILNRRAAECIIDFAPDLLWRDVLLRICSEAGCGNKDVRERFCLNGCHADKATFTKRISAALGQKQTQGKSKGYAPGEWEFYEASGEDFKNYIEFFGKRSTTRNMKVGLKRRYGSLIAEGSNLGAENKGKPLKPEENDDAETSSIVASDDGAIDEQDVVSAQDSDALDMVSD